MAITTFRHETSKFLRRIATKAKNAVIAMTAVSLVYTPYAAAGERPLDLCRAHIPVSKGGHRTSLNLKQSSESCRALEAEYNTLVEAGMKTCLVNAHAGSEIERYSETPAADCPKDQKPQGDLAQLTGALNQASGEMATADAVKMVEAYDAFIVKAGSPEYADCVYSPNGETMLTRDVASLLIAELRGELTKSHDRVQAIQEKADIKLAPANAKSAERESKKEWSLFAKREKKKPGDPKDPWREGPLSGMNPWVRGILSAAGGAFMWRMVRGGGFSTGHTQLARGLTGLGMAGIGYLNGGYDGAITGALMFPTLFIGHGKFMTIGRNGDRSKLEDALTMSGIGLARSSLAGAYRWARGYGPGYLMSGAGSGLCYYGGYQWAHNTTVAANQGFIDGPTSFGETCTGAIFGLGLSGALDF